MISNTFDIEIRYPKSGILPTYDVVGRTYDIVKQRCNLRYRRSRPMTSYTYDIVGPDLRRRFTTSQVPYLRRRNLRCAYDVIKTYVGPKYDGVWSSSYVTSYVLGCTSQVITVTSYATSYATLHTMFRLFHCGDPYCFILYSHSGWFYNGSVLMPCIAHKSSLGRFSRFGLQVRSRT